MTNTTVGDLIRKADERAVACDWGAAFERLQEACTLAPADPGVAVRLGRYQLLLGHAPDRWLPMFERAARLSSFSPVSRTELALAYAVAGKLREAADTLTDVLRMKGCPPLAPMLLALLYAQDLHHAEARELLRQATAAFPDDCDSRFLLAQYHEIELDHAQARALLHGILERDPGNARADLALKRIARRERQGWHPPEDGAAPKPRSVVMLVDDRRIDRRVLDEAMSLQEAGWDVIVVGGEAPPENPFWDEECYPDLRILRVNERGFTIASPCLMYRYSVPYTRSVAGRHIRRESLERILPDKEWHETFHRTRGFYIAAVDLPSAVYVAHDLPQLPAAAMAALYHGAHLVYDSHELFPEQSFVQKARPMLSAMEKHLAPLADRVIVVNESMVEEMAVRYDVKSGVILNCPSFDRAQLPLERTNRIRESLGIPPGRSILLYQGNIVARIRNLENVIEGMALLARDDVALVLMGPDNGGGGDLVARARKLNVLGRSVYFHPSVKQSELLMYTVSADAGLIPYTPVDWNTKYCTPNKLYEFIVAELPILANTLPELTRFVGDQGIGVNLPMGRPEDVAAAIDRFFNSDTGAFRKKLREISSRFVWQNHEGPRIVGIYESLLGTPPRLARTFTGKDSRCAVSQGSLTAGV